MTEAELKELNELREYKRMHEGKAINRAFAKLEVLIDLPHYDPAISFRAFRVIADCLIALREEIK